MWLKGHTPHDLVFDGRSQSSAKRRMGLGGTPADLRVLSSKLAGSSMDVNEEQPLKASSPRLVRPAGSSIDVIEEQPWKTNSELRLVRLAGSGIDVKEEHS